MTCSKRFIQPPRPCPAYISILYIHWRAHVLLWYKQGRKHVLVLTTTASPCTATYVLFHLTIGLRVTRPACERI
jgi:hypothetical protein